MAKKWNQRPDPDAAWKAIVAELLPEARRLCDELVASWNGVYPELPSRVIYQAVTLPLIQAKYGTDYNQTVSVAGSMLTETLYKPILQEILRQKRAAEKAAEALVDRNRPVVATTITSGREAIGSFCIITERGDRMHEHDQVLICIASQYNAGDDEMNEDAGYYNAYAEPTEAEKQTPEYQQLLAKVADDRAYEQRQRDRIEQRRQAALDAIRAEGREPTLFEDLFAGTSDN